MRIAFLAACIVGLGLVSTAAGNVTIATVPVGNVGNVGEWSGDSYGGHGPDRICGAVDYEYNIGKYEVTAGQYCEFLNAVARTDRYGLYDGQMSSSTWGCGIQRGGNPGSYIYSVSVDWAKRPVNYVSWGDAARFCNWLTNDQPTGAQDLGTTEDGAYDLNGATSRTALLAVTRKADWRWAIPSEDEWYKAAYYNATTDSYYDYPTSSNTLPGRDLADASGKNANYHGNPYPIDSPYYTTVVGEFQNSESPYGTFDQGGNVWEWNEALDWSVHRGLRGGSFYDTDLFGLDGGYLHAANRFNAGQPQYQDRHIGFRVSEAPEPTPPTADADGPYRIWVGDPLILYAGLSADPDGDIASYMWDLDDDGDFETDAGDEVFCMLDYAYIEALGLSADNVYEINLLVTDRAGLTDTATGILRVVPEPATLGLLALGGMGLLLRRRPARR